MNKQRYAMLDLGTGNSLKELFANSLILVTIPAIDIRNLCVQ